MVAGGSRKPTAGARFCAALQLIYISFCSEGLFGQYVVLTAVGEVKKVDGTEFKPKQVLPVLEMIGVFLSFAFAAWKTPLFVVGSNSVASRSVQRFSRYEVNHHWFSEGWIDETRGQHLAEAYPGFCKLWQKDQWQSPVNQAITWLIEASRTSGSVEGAIAFSQIPLEMLAWTVFVDQEAIMGFKLIRENRAASDKLQLLLHECGIPLARSLGSHQNLFDAAKLDAAHRNQGQESQPKYATRSSTPIRKNREKLERLAAARQYERQRVAA